MMQTVLQDPFQKGASCNGKQEILWCYLAPWGLDRILMAAGWFDSDPFTLKIRFDLTNWHDPILITGNVLVLIYLGFFLLGAACMIVGALRRRKRICQK